MDYYSSGIFELCYVSKANKKIEHNDLLRLVRNSRVWNASHHLTSILFYDENYFCQLMEGPLRTLDLACRRVKISSMHHQIVQLETRQVQERLNPRYAFKFYGPIALKSNFSMLAQELSKSNHDRVLLTRFIRNAVSQALDASENPGHELLES
jgi:hypothetical protein